MRNLKQRRLHLLTILFSCFVFSVSAQERIGGSPTEGVSAPSSGILGLLPVDSHSDHVLKLSEGELAYRSTAGTIDLYEQSGQRAAKIFYTAYTAKEGSAARPLTFAFNGGPGAASAYLHLGLMGPKIADFGASGDDGRTPALVDNPESWLEFTDMVFIDPVGTGWSRAENDDKAKNFYGVRQDAESIAKFISLYVQRENRLSAPKFLVGESYGGFRAVKVAKAMKDSQGLLPSGIVMVSPFLEGRFLGNSDDPLSAALQLPSLAAAKMERDNSFSLERLREAEAFALGEYLTMQVGPSPAGEDGQRFYRKLEEFTGIDRDVLEKVRGFAGSVFTRNIGEAGRVVSPYDASYSTADAYPESSYNQSDDAILDGYTRAYSSLFAFYAREYMGFATELSYTLLNQDVNRRWEWNGSRGGDARALASVSDDIRDLLSTVPGLRMSIAHGFSDALTPYGVSKYVVNHLPLSLTEGRIMSPNYRGGHMFYTRPQSRKAYSIDMKAFFLDGK